MMIPLQLGMVEYYSEDNLGFQESFGSGRWVRLSWKILAHELNKPIM